jgi:hypothetical protein
MGVRWHGYWRQFCEPRDDRGRLRQVKAVLDLILHLKERTPPFLEHALCGLKLYAVTLGELGIVYWVKDGSRWDGPRWSRCRDAKAQTSGENYDELRNGAECGDVARAGFVASLLIGADFSEQINKRVSADDFKRALGWANWFGAQKIRFFSLDDYLKFIRELKVDWEDLMKGRHPGQVGGPSSLETPDGPLLVDGKLHSDAQRAWQECVNYLVGEKLFREEVVQWAHKRSVSFRG